MATNPVSVVCVGMAGKLYTHIRFHSRPGLMARTDLLLQSLRLREDDFYAADQLSSTLEEKCSLRTEPRPRRIFGPFREQHRYPRFDQLQGSHEAI